MPHFVLKIFTVTLFLFNPNSWIYKKIAIKKSALLSIVFRFINLSDNLSICMHDFATNPRGIEGVLIEKSRSALPILGWKKVLITTTIIDCFVDGSEIHCFNMNNDAMLSFLTRSADLLSQEQSRTGIRES